MTTTCAPIPYAVDSAAPAYVVAEFQAAAALINEFTGLAFVPALDAPARLGVHWRDRVRPIGGGKHSRATDTRVLGSARASWSDLGTYRELADATIEIDRSHAWRIGSWRDYSLRAVMAHELGHVVGLNHNPDPASFMHAKVTAQQPRWTAADTRLLAEAGRKAGCAALAS